MATSRSAQPTGWRGVLFGYERRHHSVLAVAGLVFAPLIHRLLHHFHAADDADASAPAAPRDSMPHNSPRKHR